MTTDRVMAWKWEGVGLVLPERNIAHAEPNWYQLALDDEVDDPDVPWLDPLPTLRHRQLPD